MPTRTSWGTGDAPFINPEPEAPEGQKWKYQFVREIKQYQDLQKVLYEICFLCSCFFSSSCSLLLPTVFMSLGPSKSRSRTITGSSALASAWTQGHKTVRNKKGKKRQKLRKKCWAPHTIRHLRSITLPFRKPCIKMAKASSTGKFFCCDAETLAFLGWTMIPLRELIV